MILVGGRSTTAAHRGLASYCMRYTCHALSMMLGWWLLASAGGCIRICRTPGFCYALRSMWFVCRACHR